MAALPLPKYGLDKLYLFPIFQTREQYRDATGEEAPPFDPNRPPQAWFDPEAKNSTKRVIVYEHALAVAENGLPKRNADGMPFLEPLALPKAEAATVNIPYKRAGNERGADAPEVPCPVRPLDPQEELFFDFGGIPMVRNKTIAEAANFGFSPQDREILRAIARKLNVNL